MDFETSLNDATTPIMIDFKAERNVLLLAFGGLAGQLGLPLFEFNKLTGSMENINKIYLRDTQQLWYHHGLPGLGRNIEGVAATLRQYTGHSSTQRTVIFGNSGGGYAALLFGHILQVDEVHAFSPRTFINPMKRLVRGDVPRKSLRLLWQLSLHGQKKYFDLKKVFSNASVRPENFHIYYAADHANDRLHATRMQSLVGIHLHSYRYGHHGLIKHLRQSGELHAIIERAVQTINTQRARPLQQNPDDRGVFLAPVRSRA